MYGFKPSRPSTQSPRKVKSQDKRDQHKYGVRTQMTPFYDQPKIIQLKSNILVHVTPDRWLVRMACH